MTILTMFLIDNPSIVFGILSVIVIPLSIWGVTVEKKFVGTKKDITTNSRQLLVQKTELEKNKIEFQSKVRYLNGVQEQNHKEVMKELHKIQLKLIGKKDR